MNHQIFSNLLSKYVHNGKVDYMGFKSEEKELDRYLKELERIAPETLSAKERFAFYINAYNAWTIKLILTGYPGLKSIKDLGSFFKSPWKKQFVHLNHTVITLDAIEHRILRPQFKDHRVHFAINCASKGCPPLRAEAYLGITLDHQLDDATHSFINDPGRNHIEGETLYVSKIFKWFSEDFNDDVIGFFLKYATGDLKKRLLENKAHIKVKYLDYDWSLNDAH